MKIKDIKELAPEVKVNLIRALFKKAISKKDLENDDVLKLIAGGCAILELDRGDNITYFFSNKEISKKEFDKLASISETLGNSSYNITVDLKA